MATEYSISDESVPPIYSAISRVLKEVTNFRSLIVITISCNLPMGCLALEHTRCPESIEGAVAVLLVVDNSPLPNEKTETTNSYLNQATEHLF